MYETYATAKAGLAYFGEAPRRELKREGILSIPVGADTPMMKSNRAWLEPGFTRELASVVADAVAEGNETAALDVISSGLPSAQMIALNRENLAAVSERLLSLKAALEDAVKNHSGALSARQFKYGVQL